MKFGARLIICGSILGSFFLGSFFYLFSDHIFSDLGSDQYSHRSTLDSITGNSELENAGKSIHASAAEMPRDFCEINQNYPKKVFRWCDLISLYARDRNLPPDLVAALILQESGGNPKAYSGSGAVGLMQIMPRDGLAAAFMCVNGPCFHDRPPKAKLVDPEFNIKYGTRMLARLHNKHGDIREALKAYGPMDVGYYYADRVLAIYDTYHQ
jgi:soluble lytic murein transglycosylase-like protein